jgi:hypothetical protein
MTPKLSGLPPDVASILQSMGYAFDDGPNYTHSILYNYLSSKKQKATIIYIGSSVVDWLLEVSALLRTVMKFALVSVFPFLRTCSREVDFSGGVIETRYIVIANCFCAVTMIERDLTPLSPVTAFQSRDAFAELWYSARTLSIPDYQRHPC